MDSDPSETKPLGSWAKAKNIMHACRVGHYKWYQEPTLDQFKCGSPCRLQGLAYRETHRPKQTISYMHIGWGVTSTISIQQLQDMSMGNGPVSVGDHVMIKSKATQRLSNSSHDTCPRREVPVVSNLTWEIAHVWFVLLQVGNSMEKPIPFLDQIKHHMQ